ncbi:MAG: Gfo/Idh/MocA family protein [Prevotella sp.]
MERMSAAQALETFTPARTAGQRDVLSLVLPPMPRLQVAFVGVGARGRMAVARWCHIPGVEIAAVCDVSRQVAEEVAQHVEQLGHPRPIVYGGEQAYIDLCQQQAIHLVYVCTDWMSHVPIALHAMQQGKCVAVEVPAALTLNDIWQLIDTAERTRRHCMMLENAVYDHFEMAVCQMARAGLFGELVHVEGGYAHPLGSQWTPWRMEYTRLHAGDIYPTHSIGPACRLLDIHRSDRMHYLTAMQTNAFRGAEMYQEVTGKACDCFANGDQTSTMIRTLKGKTILLQHNVMTPRPYSRMFQAVGTQGYAAKYPVPEVLLSPDAAAKVGIEMENSNQPLSASQIETLLHHYAPAFTPETIALAQQLDARGGMSYFMDLRLAQCLQQGLPLDMDVYDLAEWCCIAELSKLSIKHSSMPVMIPDFVHRTPSGR